MRVLQYDYDNLPELPFNVYFVDYEGSVYPKRIFTVTRKRIDLDKKSVELFILELGKFVGYDVRSLQVVAEYHVN